jgi:methyl-accepting chemotaxis protein
MDDTLRAVLLTLEAAIHQTSVTEARERLDLDTLAAAVSRQARSVAELDSAIQQVAAGAGEAAAAAEAGAAHAGDLTRLAADGRRDLASIHLRLTEVEATARQTEARVNLLLAEVGAIGRIAATVGRIAGRTTILSLNAAIEAAHAGAQGAGFAIVAQEVRRLADQASASAREISDIVSRLETGVDTTGRAVKELAGAAATASDAAGLAEQRLDSMYGLLTDVAGVVAQTSETAVAQAALAEEMAAAAEELRQQAETVASTAGAMGQRSNGTQTEAAYSALARFRYGGQFEWALDLAQACADAAGRMITAFDPDYTEIKGPLIGRLGRLFDVSRVPDTGFDPPKYMTPTDEQVDKQVIALLDELIAPVRSRIASIGVVDLNGFALAVPSFVCQDWTGLPEQDTQNNRIKRIFDDQVGLRAARVGLQHAEAVPSRASRADFLRAGVDPDQTGGDPFLVQTYARDTGLVVMDISVPLFTQDGRRYGAIRLGLMA